jgi:cytosine deaminase
MSDDSSFLAAAIAEARIGVSEGGIPIGAALVVDGQVVATGRTGACSRAVPSAMGRPTASRTPAD